MYTDIDIDEYQARFADADPGGYLLLDVREIDEYEEGHLPGAVNLPLSELQARIDEVEDERPIVLVCASGGRSAMAAEFMASMGYDGLYNLSDGTMGWQRRGLPIEK